jgi:hypothetical protein
MASYDVASNIREAIIARHVVQLISNPHFLSYMASLKDKMQRELA